MIQKVFKVMDLEDKGAVAEDYRYWRGKKSDERIAAVEYLRRQFHGSSARLQRVARVIQRP